MGPLQWTTVAQVLIYGSLILTIFFFEHLPAVPQKAQQQPLSIEKAYSDLQLITAKAHPYNSHQNDLVHDFIRRRVEDLAANYSNIQFEDDSISNITIARSNAATYFEGTNILVRARGTTSLPAVLYSAHYDSVSTAPGATDDGMGAVTVLQLIEAFAQFPAKRDVIFNINNGEEDGLHGALAFIQHPWSSNISSFINLEGAGGGGQAMLFRSTTTALAKKFKSSPHPHANCIAEDALERRLIRSATDYTVYNTAGIPGSDIAFFKRRAIYHTKDDSVPTLGGQRSLWNMLESAYFTGRATADDEKLDATSGGRAVYFDLFGEAMVVSSLKHYFIINIVLLAVGALAVGLGTVFGIYWKKLQWKSSDLLRFPLTLGVALVGVAGSILLVNFINPYIVYSSSYMVLAMQLSWTFIFLYLPLRLLAPAEGTRDHGDATLFQLFVLAWVLLLLDVIGIGQLGYSGMYFTTYLYGAVLLAESLALAERLEVFPFFQHKFTSYVKRRPGEAHPGSEPGETTPLLAQEQPTQQPEEANDILFSLQYTIAALFPGVILLEMTLIAFASLQGTLADGNSPLLVYLLVGTTTFFAVLPHAPFIHRVGKGFTTAVAGILILSTLYNCFAFPFSQYSPLKVRFSQSVDLDEGVNQISVSGLGGYLSDRVLAEIPSASYAGSNFTCDKKATDGLHTCRWKGIPPAVASGKPQEWLNFETHLERPGLGLIKVGGVDSRFCKIYFNDSVHHLSVRGSTGGFHKDYPIPSKGVKEFHLWSRTWNRTFEVEVGWDETTPVSGKIACAWDDIREGKIAALDELLAFVPSWATVTKAKAGLVEVTRKFSFK